MRDSEQSLAIQLVGKTDRPGVAYEAGSEVTGLVKLDLQKPLHLTVTRITIKGRAFVHWTEQSLRGAGEPRFKDTRHHSASEDYFDQTLLLYCQAKNDKTNKGCLPVGRHTFPFNFKLPAVLPCSFEGEFGYIRYWVKAVIEKGMEQCDVTKMPFTVVSPLDLNTIPDSYVPVSESTEKRLCCFCCMSGPISAMLSIPKRGFVPGEPIRFGAELSNLSSRKMASYSVELKMTTVFKTPVKTRSITKQLCKVKRDSVGRGESDTWLCDQLIVPHITPSGLVGCGIINVRYSLELRVDPVGPAFDLILPLDVIIGTIPHRSYHDTLHSAYIHLSSVHLSPAHPCSSHHNTSNHSSAGQQSGSMCLPQCEVPRQQRGTLCSPQLEVMGQQIDTSCSSEREETGQKGSTSCSPQREVPKQQSDTSCSSHREIRGQQSGNTSSPNHDVPKQQCCVTGSPHREIHTQEGNKKCSSHRVEPQHQCGVTRSPQDGAHKEEGGGAGSSQRGITKQQSLATFPPKREVSKHTIHEMHLVVNPTYSSSLAIQTSSLYPGTSRQDNNPQGQCQTLGSNIKLDKKQGRWSLGTPV